MIRCDTRVTVWRAREATIVGQIFMGRLLRREQESRWWQDASLEGLERNPDEPNHGRVPEDDLVRYDWGRFTVFSSEVMAGILWERFRGMVLEIQSRGLNLTLMKVLWAELIHVWFPWNIEELEWVCRKNLSRTAVSSWADETYSWVPLSVYWFIVNKQPVDQLIPASGSLCWHTCPLIGHLDIPAVPRLVNIEDSGSEGAQ